MAEPYLGDIRMVGFNWNPRGYALANGAILPINQNQSLYSLFGTMYGGNGRTDFGIPDLRGRVPIHVGNSNTTGSTNHNQGVKGGEQAVNLTDATIPNHQHTMFANSQDADTNTPTTNVNLLGKANIDMYREPANLTALETGTITSTGNQAHDNQQPYQAINFIVAVTGLFPSRN